MREKDAKPAGVIHLPWIRTDEIYSCVNENTLRNRENNRWAEVCNGWKVSLASPTLAEWCKQLIVFNEKKTSITRRRNQKIENGNVTI
jgi:hypothetical protein